MPIQGWFWQLLPKSQFDFLWLESLYSVGSVVSGRIYNQMLVILKYGGPFTLLLFSAFSFSVFSCQTLWHKNDPLATSPFVPTVQWSLLHNPGKHGQLPRVAVEEGCICNQLSQVRLARPIVVVFLTLRCLQLDEKTGGVACFAVYFLIEMEYVFVSIFVSIQDACSQQTKTKTPLEWKLFS